MPPPDVRLWAALLNAKIDLSGLVDPVEKDEEEAKAEKECQAIQEELRQLQTGDLAHPLNAEVKRLEELNRVLDKAKAAIAAVSRPHLAPEDSALQNSAISLGREVGMEGLTQLRAMLGTAGGVNGLQELISRSACVETLLKDSGVEGTKELVSRSACVNSLLRKGGLEDKDELQHAVSMVQLLRKELGLANDTLENAETFVESALVIHRSSQGNMALAKTAINLGGNGPHKVKSPRKIAQMLERMAKALNPEDNFDEILELMVVAKQPGGAKALRDKATAFDAYRSQANSTVEQAAAQAHEISTLVGQAGGFEKLKAMAQALANIDNPGEVLEKATAMDTARSHLVQYLDNKYPHKGFGQALKDGDISSFLDLHHKTLSVVVNRDLRPRARVTTEHP